MKRQSGFLDKSNSIGIPVIRTVKSFLKELWAISEGPVMLALGLLGGWIGVASAVSLPNGMLSEELSLSINVALVTLVLSLIIIFIWATFQVKKRVLVQPVQLHEERTFILAEGDYWANAKEFFERYIVQGGEAAGYICVVGMDASGRLDRTFTHGVLRSLIELVSIGRVESDLQTVNLVNQSVELKHLQEQIDAAIAENNIATKTTIEVADGTDRINRIPIYENGLCVLVDCPLLKSDKGQNGKMLLVANSLNYEGCTEQEKEIEGANTMDVLPLVFSALIEHGCQESFFPVLGTNQIDSGYQLVISSIISRFFSAWRNQNAQFNVILSVRKKDIRREGLSLVRIQHFVKEASRFYSEV